MEKDEISAEGVRAEVATEILLSLKNGLADRRTPEQIADDAATYVMCVFAKARSLALSGREAEIARLKTLLPTEEKQIIEGVAYLMERLQAAADRLADEDRLSDTMAALDAKAYLRTQEAEIARLQKALGKIDTYCAGDDMDTMECSNCRDKGFDHYFALKKLARVALTQGKD